ncbi:hypothetical protein BDV26DRAFT_285665 [Aspergillus bertholletiae]|uniref:Uncharacterized protein n=1 Tax=Aspergillus bertholletiae TaxID=1226010 RepID=A0A5N7AUU9_9EURO|nr:hypothetical protein BDV26DRAFT_285665 [Aspergillus bertholletiae]
MRPPTDDALVLTRLNDRRVLFFWFLQISGIVQFILWLMAAIKVAGIPVSINLQAVMRIHELESSSSNAIISNGALRQNSALPAQGSLKQTSIDVWFALAFAVTVDASAVVFTFNRSLIRKFHNVVSQRLMFLSALLSWAFWSWNQVNMTFTSRHPVLSFALGLAMYILLGFGLDKLEKRALSPEAISRRKTFAEYSKELGQVEISWRRATSLSIIVVGLGLFLSKLIPYPWSAALPVIYILLESVILSVIGARRTPRYAFICSPSFFAVACVHWGVRPLHQSPYLSVTAESFLGLVLLGRVLLDAHLRTTLRPFPELQWSRQNALISTSKLLAMCLVVLLLDNIGFKVLTFIKPIAVLVFFGLGGAAYMGAAAYHIAANVLLAPCVYIGIRGNHPADR